MYKLNQRGLTVVELIITMVVGSFLAGATSLIVINQAHISQRGRDLVLSNSFAETKIEQLRSAGYLNLTNGTTDITSELPAELKPPKSALLQISDYDTGIKQVDLNISYSEKGQTRTYDYKTFVGELGVGQY
jgi:prepilin-type N-terminal cleavage/methylation domain-containing protein